MSGSVRIIIPAYNEAANLPAVCAAIAQALPLNLYTLYIVNDGSRDNTAEVLATLNKSHPIVTLTHSPNKGVAQAFRTGIGTALSDSRDGDFIFIMEGDNTSSADLLLRMIEKLQQDSDVVIASRYRPGGAYKGFPLKRLILSRGANTIFRLFFPITGVTDYSIFYRGYRVTPLRAAWRHHGPAFITVTTFFANIEILLKLQPFTKKISEVPLVYDYSRKRGKSSMPVWKNFKSYLAFMLRHLLGWRDG